MKILLCEDDANIATITRLSLEQIGKHEVVWVTDGKTALDRGCNEKFDLILLDDMMPQLSGVDVCRSYIESGKTVAPVIFMSANPQDKNVEKFRSLAIGYIPKPFDPMSLNTQIDQIVGRSVKKAV